MPTFPLDALCKTLVYHNIQPVASFTAAAGADYGQVLAYPLGGGSYLIKYGNIGRTEFTITSGQDDINDLAYFLETRDFERSRDMILHEANVRGADVIAEATANDCGTFLILTTRNSNGPLQKSIFVSDKNGDPVEFNHYHLAKEWVRDAENKAYVSDSNESGAPIYKVMLA